MSKTASTIAASIVHSKLDYCNSLYYNLPKSQINRQVHVKLFYRIVSYRMSFFRLLSDYFKLCSDTVVHLKFI